MNTKSENSVDKIIALLMKSGPIVNRAKTIESLLIQCSINELKISSPCRQKPAWNISTEALHDLCKALKFNRTVKRLSLPCLYIGDSGAIAIADLLAENSALRFLDLTLNNIGTQGAIAIGKSLAQNENLEQLVLAANNLNDDGVTAVANSLPKNNSLCELDISGNHVTDAGLDQIYRALCCNLRITNIKYDAGFFKYSKIDERCRYNKNNMIIIVALKMLMLSQGAERRDRQFASEDIQPFDLPLELIAHILRFSFPRPSVALVCELSKSIGFVFKYRVQPESKMTDMIAAVLEEASSRGFYFDSP